MSVLGTFFGRRERGQLGEDAAARYLESVGYRVLERNWRYRQWELDLVCQGRDGLVFVEVKTRAAGAMADPAGALNRDKQARLAKAAARYLSAQDAWDQPYRFDLVTVVDTGQGLDVEHFENAFDLSGMADMSGSAW